MEERELSAVPLAQHSVLLIAACDLAVNVVHDPRSFRVVDQAANVTVELGHNHIPSLLVALDNHLRNQEFAVSALRKAAEVTLQLLCDVLPLLHVGILERTLDNTHAVVLEDKVANAAIDDSEQLVDQFFALLLRNVRLAAQPLPDLLRAGNDIRVGFGGLALFGESTLFRVGLSRRTVQFELFGVAVAVFRSLSLRRLAGILYAHTSHILVLI